MPFDLDALLGDAERRGASDLLLVPGAPPTIRLHGDLMAAGPGTDLLGPDDASDMLSVFLPPQHSEEFRAGHAVDFCFEKPGIGRFRCNLHRDRGGVAASLRLLPETIPDFSTLNLPAQVARFAEVLKGFILVAGPTGAGKSTTLACLIDMINSRRAAHIVTIEDPVEYRHRHRRGVVEQIEVGADTPSFAAALRHTLRQDPDVILVGEMRDLETIGIALTAAETGHLVLSSLHTNDTTQAIDRILDVFPAHHQPQVRQQIALSLTGVVAQHLIPVMDGKGRVPAVEILVATDAVRNLIRTSKTHQLYSTIANSRAAGMQTLEESLAGLCKRHRITREDALLRSTHADELESLMR
ncbi:MAG TPA: PilT/PilU family type 4a pilus ATPase [Candidatus Polarisedimenticolia bacterium]|jgi:twitching motility protein PilT